MPKAEIKRVVRLGWLGLPRLFEACVRHQRLGWRSLWFGTRNVTLMTDEEKRGLMMVQLAFLVTYKHKEKTYVAIYQRRAPGHLGPRWVDGAAVLFGESLITPGVMASDEAMTDLFWESAPFEKSGSVAFEPLGVGVSRRLKTTSGGQRDVRKHLFVIYKALLSSDAHLCQHLADTIESIPAKPLSTLAGGGDGNSCMVPTDEAIKVLNGKLMDQLAIKLLSRDFDQIQDGSNRAFLRRGGPRGSPHGYLQRFLADGERAAWSLNAVISILLIFFFVPQFFRLVVAWFR